MYDNNRDNWTMQGTSKMIHNICGVGFSYNGVTKEHSDNFTYIYDTRCSGTASKRYFDEPCSASD